MQRAASAVDFSNLLNPSPVMGTLAVSDCDPVDSVPLRVADEMSAPGVTAIKPNGPVPGPQAASDSGELPRPYKCPLCDKAFHRLEHQTRHIRTHTGEKPHACQFPGCSKKFSRSDELTRHSRIHNNPNSRRGNKTQQQQHLHQLPHQHPLQTSHQLSLQHSQSRALQHLRHAIEQAPYSHPEPHQLPQPHARHLPHAVRPQPMQVDGMMGPPPGPKSIRSAPPSALASPNVSPPTSFASYAMPPGGLSHHYGAVRGTEMNVLATAASQVEREVMSGPKPPSGFPSTRPRLGGRGHPSLATFHLSRRQDPFTQSPFSQHHFEEEDHYNSYRQAKRSRPNSPNSTAPSSPTFSHDSLSPTPDHTPIATPAHSPRLRPYSGYELPSIRSLSLHQNTIPALAPMEPNPETSSFPVQAAPSRHGISLSDIMSRPEGSQRKLPVPQVPKVSVQDLLSDAFPASGRSSATASLAGGDLETRF